MFVEIIKTFPAVLILSFILDAIIGDPRWLPHPVKLMGRLIFFLDVKLNTNDNNNKMLIFNGCLNVLIIVGLTGFISGVLLLISFRLSFWFGFIVEIVMSTYCIAAHDLIKHAMNVYNNRYDIDKARIAVGMIVGRETSNLSEQGVIKATIESIAESTSDGIIAPAFYIILFGPIGGLVYKAINTMDSMIGYHNNKYEYYGKPAAIVDDIVNFIPSRLSALCMIAGAFILSLLNKITDVIKNKLGRDGFKEGEDRIEMGDGIPEKSDEGCDKRVGKVPGKVHGTNCGIDFIGAYRVWRRDRRKHASPNSAQTESAMAGALGLRLGGPAVYFGKTVDKPYIGDEVARDAEWEDIKRAGTLMYVSALVFVIASVLIFGALIHYA